MTNKQINLPWGVPDLRYTYAAGEPQGNPCVLVLEFCVPAPTVIVILLYFFLHEWNSVKLDKH